MDSLVVGLKALADGKRLEILRLLLHHEYCVGALAARLDISASAVSQHLKILRQAGFVRGEKRGYWTHYQLQGKNIEECISKLSAWLSQVDPAAEPPYCPAHGSCQGRHDPCPSSLRRG